MTVKRQRSVTYNATKEIVAEGVRKVLAANRNYTDTVEGIDGSFFTLVQPNPLLLDTPMRITIEQNSDNTTVSVSTKSQPFIWGDIFGYYNKYITNFLSALEKEIRK